MERAGDWRSSPRVDIGGGARDRTRRRQPAEQRRADVRNPLADQLLVRPVPESGHAVGDDARQQRLDSGEKSDGERRWQDLPDLGQRECRDFRHRQPSREMRESGTERVHGQLQGGNGRRRRNDRSEEHTSELQSRMRNSYAAFSLKKNNTAPPMTED